MGYFRLRDEDEKRCVQVCERVKRMFKKKTFTLLVFNVNSLICRVSLVDACKSAFLYLCTCTVCVCSSKCTHTKLTAWPGQLGLRVNVQWSCEFSQTHCIAPSLHMGPSCLFLTSQLQPLQATGDIFKLDFCSLSVVLDCILFRMTARSEARLV